jgi:outer membrane receptor for ferrienterochelin and colicin
MVFRNLFFGLFATVLLAVPVFAQETTSAIRGTVISSSGAEISGASVSVTHEPSGSVSSQVTNSQGIFLARNLRVGGPYSVAVTSAEGYKIIDNIYLALGETDKLKVIIGSSSSQEEVVVYGQKLSTSGLMTGPRSTLTSDQIGRIASVKRDLKDAVATQPFVNVYSISFNGDDTESISIAGANARYSSFSVDGIGQSDDFGLEYGGYPGVRSPISLDSVEQVNVSVVDFDVRDSGSTAGNVNVVTKSGTNEFSGSAYGYQMGDSWVGDQIEDQSVTIGEFDEETVGYTFGGPVIEDKLFFFINYDKFEKTEPGVWGAKGSGALREVDGVSLAQATEIINLAKSVYNYDAGSASGMNNELLDEDLLVKLDWNMNDSQRMTYTHQTSENNDVREYGGSENTLALTSGNYTKTTELQSDSFQIFSDWTDNFSTTIRYGMRTVDTAQASVGGDDFMRAVVELGEGDRGPQVIMGPDVYRHYNSLQTDTSEFEFEMSYLAGSHELVAGMHKNSVDVANGFVAYSDGELLFASASDFENKTPYSIDYRNAPSGNPADGSAAFEIETTSFYIQDTWDYSDKLTLQFGVRMEEYSMDQAPKYNSVLFDNHGIRNDTSLDGKDIVLPRFGFTYEQGDLGMMKDVTLRGGMGYFTGGRPNVWMGGTFSNDGIGIQNASVPLSAAAGFNGFDTTPFDSYIYQPGAPGFRPAYADIMDPNFELPKDMKMSIGMDWELGDGYFFSADYLKTETDKDLHFKQLRLGNPAFAGSVNCPAIGNTVSNMPIGTAVDGRQIYADYSYCGKAMEKFYDSRGYDMLLTNTDKGHSELVSLSMAKTWDNWDVYASYTWQDVQSVGNLSSSRNISNFKYTTKYANFNEDVLHRSIYSREHTFNFVANYTKYFFSDHPTIFTFVGAAISGEPFSYTFGNYKDGALWGLDKESTRDATAAFYVPNGDVVVPSYFQSDLDSYIAAAGLSGYAGGFAPINGFETDWNYRLDFKLTQEFPGLGLTDKDKFVLTLDVENLLNLIDSEYGRQTKASASDRSIAEAVPVSLGDGNFTYQYKPAYKMSLAKIHNESTNYYRSLYRIQLGFKYMF